MTTINSETVYTHTTLVGYLLDNGKTLLCTLYFRNDKSVS